MFKIIGKYNYGTFEVVDSADCLNEAYGLLHEYKLSFGNEWDLEVIDLTPLKLILEANGIIFSEF